MILATAHGSPSGEEMVRTRIQKLKHPEWIAAGEKRSPEIQRELDQGPATRFLPPPAPFNLKDATAGTSTSDNKADVRPTLAPPDTKVPRPQVSMPSIDVPRPTPPALPPPAPVSHD
jgi:hypothetical protein